jgi:hypothetical protein
MTICRLDRPAPGNSQGLFDRPLPLWGCAALLLAFSLVPVGYVARQYEHDPTLSGLILFGQVFETRELPEIKALHPAILSRDGYDGQYYAQIALDPTLRRPDLQAASDGLEYRAQRWLLPALAYVLGLGRPAAIIAAYALLNLLFWFGLVALLVVYLRARSLRDYACVAACALGTGALVSVERSLSDLPAATLGLGAAMLDGVGASVVLGLAMLTKPTLVVFLMRYFWPLPRNAREVPARAGLVLLALLPLCLLNLYIYRVVGAVSGGGDNLGVPVVPLLRWIGTTWTHLQATPFGLSFLKPTRWEWKLFEVLGPLSLIVQATHLAIWRKPACPVWWLGASFALLLLFLTPASLVEHVCSTRTLLPLTLAFNLRLAGQRGAGSLAYFIAGNVGLLFNLHSMIAFCLR